MAKDPGRHFTKEDIQITTKHIKSTQHHLSPAKCKLKSHGHTSTEWLKLNRWTMKNVEQFRRLYIVGGSIYLYNRFGKWQYLPKLNIYQPFDSTIPCLGIYPTKMSVVFSKRLV